MKSLFEVAFFKSWWTRILIIVVAYATCFLLLFWVEWPYAVVSGCNVFFVLYLIFACARFDDLNKTVLRKVAITSGTPNFVLFLITLSTMSNALIALFWIVNAHPKSHPAWLALAMLSVPLGWATIQMMAAFHYAHLFWRLGSDGKPGKGLRFPGTPNPGGLEFVYFAFVIGISAETSDVAISRPFMRRFVLAHSIVSYFFNTVLVAAAVNLAVA